MEFRPLEQGKRAGCELPGPVWPEAVDVDRLSLFELRARLGTIKRAEARLAAMKVATLAAYRSQGGEGLARRVVLEELQASKQQARREVETASQFSQVPETLDALGAGEIPEGHAKRIAKAASQGPIDESVLVEAARHQDFGTFSRTLRDHQHEQSVDDGKSWRAKERERRSMSFFKSPEDGMFILNGRFDSVAGNRIEAALAAEIRRQRNENESADKVPFDQRMADALENLVCADAEDRKPQGTTLILTADWDALNQKLADARLLDGTPLPVAEALRLGCNADIDNLVLVCTSCHHNIHDDGWTVGRDRHGAYELRPPPKPYADYQPWKFKPNLDSDPFPDTGVSYHRPTQAVSVLLR